MTDFKSMVVHRIRVARADARMSQEELAKAAGVSAESIKNENGVVPALSDGGAAHKGAGRVSLGCREHKALTLPMEACGL